MSIVYRAGKARKFVEWYSRVIGPSGFGLGTPGSGWLMGSRMARLLQTEDPPDHHNHHAHVKT